MADTITCPACGVPFAHVCAIDEELWDCAQTAAFLGISESTLEKMRLRKSGPPYISLGRPRYLRSDVLAWLRTRKRAA